MFKVYIAGRYERRSELLDKADIIKRYGSEVVSTWLRRDEEHKTPMEWACQDLADLESARALILFTSGVSSGYSSGGHLVEFGYALAKKKAIIIIGPLANIFTHLTGIVHYPTWDGFLDMQEKRIGSGYYYPVSLDVFQGYPLADSTCPQGYVYGVTCTDNCQQCMIDLPKECDVYNG